MSIILSIYLVLLSCMSCSDIEVNSLAHSEIEYSSASDTHSHDKENDLCPPFCVCNCCGAQALSYFPQKAIDFPLASAIITLPLPSYQPIFSSNFYGSIWQPPQIA